MLLYCNRIYYYY